MRKFAAQQDNKMDKYTVLQAVRRGSFYERLCHLYMKTGDYIDMERLEGRSVSHVKVLLSDAKNQYDTLLHSQLWQDYLSAVPCSVIEQPPLDGSKISLLVKTSDADSPFVFNSIRLTEAEANGLDASKQTALLLEKFIKKLNDEGMTLAENGISAWLYVADIDTNYQAVAAVRNGIFSKNGLTASSHSIVGTCVEGSTWAKNAIVAMDYLASPNTKASGRSYLNAPEKLCSAADYGVNIERGIRIDRGTERLFFVSGTTSIDAKGEVAYRGEILKQTGRLLENIGALLANGGATMNDIRCFMIYLRDASDYAEVDKFMGAVFPYTPRVIVQAKTCCPEWLIEMECIAEKEG